jgi:hypothetical protein
MRWRSSVTDVLTRLEGFLHRACLRHRLWLQIDHANALRCELGEYGVGPSAGSISNRCHIIED